MSSPFGFLEAHKDEVKLVICGLDPFEDSVEGECSICPSPVWMSQTSKTILDTEPKAQALCTMCAVSYVRQDQPVYMTGKNESGTDVTGVKVGTNLLEVMTELVMNRNGETFDEKVNRMGKEQNDVDSNGSDAS